MRVRHLSAPNFIPFALAACCGALGYWYVDLVILEPAYSSILLAISMLGGAVLVRLARNSPVTQPAAFNDEDLARFFDALELLARRLFLIFVQVIVTLVVVVVAIVVTGMAKRSVVGAIAAAPYIAGLLCFLLAWVFFRLVAMVYGDVGVLRLQRVVLQHALDRERIKIAEKKVGALPDFRASGSFGRALPPLPES